MQKARLSHDEKIDPYEEIKIRIEMTRKTFIKYFSILTKRKLEISVTIRRENLNFKSSNNQKTRII